jgi:predicted dehydrogenase
VDYLLSVWGTPPAVMTRTANRYSSGEGVDHVLTQYLYEDFVCSAEGSWALPGSFPFNMAFQVMGELGLLSFSLLQEPNLLFYPAQGEPYAPEIAPGTGYERELRYFVDCLEEGREPLRVPPESTRESVRVVAAERESARTGSPVQLS